MAASSALKMTAVCAVLVILLSTAAQPTMAVLPAVDYFKGLDIFALIDKLQCYNDLSYCKKPCVDFCTEITKTAVCEKIRCGQTYSECLRKVQGGCDALCTNVCTA